MVLCIFTVFSNLLLLFPTAWQHVRDVERLYQAESANTTDRDLVEMQMSRAELEKSVAFAIERRSLDIWVRWAASLALFLAHLAATYSLVRKNSRGARIALSITATLYLVGWVGFVVTLEGSSGGTLLDDFVERVVIECTATPPLWVARFLIVHCVAPLAYLFMLFSLLWQRFGEERSGTDPE